MECGKTCQCLVVFVDIGKRKFFGYCEPNAIKDHIDNRTSNIKVCYCNDKFSHQDNYCKKMHFLRHLFGALIQQGLLFGTNSVILWYLFLCCLYINYLHYP